MGTKDLELDEVKPKQANYVNGLARKLYSLLAKSRLCREAHAAQLHLSGFLSPSADNSFEVYISTICGGKHIGIQLHIDGQATSL